jgi:hypothetical protein
MNGYYNLKGTRTFGEVEDIWRCEDEVRTMKADRSYLAWRIYELQQVIAYSTANYPPPP